MNIGSKLKEARAESKMTQEQAAEALGVSRQTISNWENEKSFPDIVSVVKMSEMYHVSLDCLLKGEEEAMNDYVDYLKESTDVVKSKERTGKLTIVMTFLAIWMGMVLLYWVTVGPADVMGYEILFEYIVLPVVELIIGYQIGRNNYWGRAKWLMAVPAGLLHMGLQAVTLGAQIYFAYHRFETIYFLNVVLAAIGVIAALVGIMCGYNVYLREKKKEAATAKTEA
ncbi:MAG: helix-turn-helix transcriptional regulator [Lachnospiraceae bacterium]|nr:helix-turn-helix transcriptional regulator [Lachnospiraceae bacterium]